MHPKVCREKPGNKVSGKGELDDPLDWENGHAAKRSWVADLMMLGVQILPSPFIVMQDVIMRRKSLGYKTKCKSME